MATTTHLSTDEVFALFQQYVIPNYRRYPVVLARGEGVHVWDSEGKRYLDLFPGWGCNLLGHCPAPVVAAVQEQLTRLMHVPNTWFTAAQGLWAKALSERSFHGMAFFCNSGAEANEAAIKLVRLHQGPGRYKIIVFEGGFHGRTMGALSATAQPKYHEGLHPLLPGFSYCPYGDLEAVRQRIDGETAAIMIEPIQGEGGVVLPPDGFLQGLRELADEHRLLLIFDEVQTGCGRTGEWFAYQSFGVVPDVMTLAKSLCGGLPGGAVLARREIAPSLRAGMHASTFGGNPVAAAAGLAVIEMIETQSLLERAKAIGNLFLERFRELAGRCSMVREVRGAGLMIGLELVVDGTPVVNECLRRGLLINCTHGTVIRLLPAVTMTDEQVQEGCDILCRVIEDYAAGGLESKAEA
ncbi:MAG: aspartate aminotransferase family protein [Thermogutta sp.]|nr:aspartate aminotransferase family protein [Thermogutta sp.]